MAESSAASWSTLRSFMRDRCGVTLAEDQHYLMEARLAPVAKDLKFASVDEFVLAACKPGAARTIISPLVDAMTTHETYFFRDSGFWKVLTDDIIPRLLAACPSGPLRIWSAACSTGQEPYSLVMLFDEKFPQHLGRLSIVATDVSEGVLETARNASYTVFEVNRGITAPRLMRHFERDGGHFRVKPHLRQLITWSPHNLITQPPPGDGFDLVLVRNVLIYFAEGPRQQVLARLKGSLKPTGFLGLGSTELFSGPGSQAIAPGWYPAR
ncbi:MAG: CheR family methyltransferase [Myxococcota bacterium]